ncbi:MAG: hypothetical protein AB7T63_10505 [Planctomycetota bacterium]
MRALPLIVSVTALVVAILAYNRSPSAMTSLPGKGLDAYDLSEPRAAWKAQFAMQEAVDFRAMSELGLLASKERRETAEVIDTAPYGEEVILFLRHKESGKTKQTTRGMKKLPGHDVWMEDYVSSYEVRAFDEDLSQRMKDWEDGSEK